METDNVPRNPTIRNNTAEFLIFTSQAADRELEEKATTEDSSVVQREDSVIRNFRITAANGKKTASPTTQNEHFLTISAWICIQKPDFIYITARNRSIGKDVYIPPQDQRDIQGLNCAWGID